jgi:excinuclease ABC subunit C
MAHSLSEKLKKVPTDPGVYLMKGEKGDVIYVGKARNLKKRLSSYFIGKLNIKTSVLVKKIVRFETIITATENEALILESNLIKKHRPRYNVILKDDKRYPSLRLDMQNPYPFLSIVRKIKNDGAAYFGPFSSSSAVKSTVKLINRTFKLRKCKLKSFQKRSRPCLNHQMDICLGPCCNNIDKEAYKDIVKEVAMFLNGKAPDLIRKIKSQMVQVSEMQEFEAAAQLRDKMFAIEKIIEKQVAVTRDLLDRDAIAISGSHEDSVITVLFVRGGFLVGTRHFAFSETISTEAEVVETFIRQHYEKANVIPQEILVPMALENSSMLEQWLKTLRKSKVSILWPQRGGKARLVKMAWHNAQNELKTRISIRKEKRELLERLQKRLKTEKFPDHIECFDNSNISGAEPVAGMVVYKSGSSHKASYRKYRIKTVKIQDDYGYMFEVLKRRFSKKEHKLPDLLMVDGGRGQLNIAVSVLKELNLFGNFDIISIAKKDEKRGESDDKIYKPGRVNTINFGKQGDLLLFLQKIRDEAHRFAISFHRKRRSKASLKSVFDEIPGIGKKRKEILLKNFKGIKKIRAATLQELSQLPGMNKNAARAVKDHLK